MPRKNAEQQRLDAANRGEQPWRRWGPYLSERQWGTVREDYSPHGNAWKTFPTSMLAVGITAGAKMGWPASVTTNNTCALP